MSLVHTLAMKRIRKNRKESETIRSGTERGMNAVKTTKPKPKKPKNPAKSKSVKVSKY